MALSQPETERTTWFIPTQDLPYNQNTWIPMLAGALEIGLANLFMGTAFDNLAHINTSLTMLNFSWGIVAFMWPVSWMFFGRLNNLQPPSKLF